MITCPAVTKRSIRSHYELGTFFYRLLWGVHIHHGLWEEDESPTLSPAQAQRRLIDFLAEQAQIPQQAEVLDVGCGMGGSALQLARSHQCRVTGLTLSRFQQSWAALSARMQGVGNRTRFFKQDAETAEFPEGTFDVVWSIECTEHLFDKPAFFRRVAQALRPTGRLAVCAWLAGDEPYSDDARQQIFDVCEGFLCPSLGTAEDYQTWITQAGLQWKSFTDLTPQVTRTWEICSRRLRRSGVGWLAPLFGRDMVRFTRRFDTILNAYRTGAMKYGCFVAEKKGTQKDGFEENETEESNRFPKPKGY